MITTVMLESPYSGDVLFHVNYARQCMMDSVKRGEAPFVPHLLYTQSEKSGWALETKGNTDEKHWISREEGLQLAAAWRAKADKTVLYIDHGMTAGMLRAEEEAVKMGKPVERRKLYAEE
jgi:hypothetical protein